MCGALSGAGLVTRLFHLSPARVLFLVSQTGERAHHTMAKNIDDYEVPEEDTAILLSMCGLPPGDPLPDKVKKQYLLHRIIADRVGMPLIDHDLAMIVILSGGQSSVPKKQPPTILELWQDKEISRGSDVLCTWRRKTNVPAILIDVRKSMPVVCLKDDDNAEERVLEGPEVYLTPI